MIKKAIVAAAASVAALSLAVVANAETKQRPAPSTAPSTSAPSETAPSTSAPSATPAPSTAPSRSSAAPGASQEFTDAQLRSYVAASAEISSILQPGTTQVTPQQAERIRTTLTNNNLDRDTFNAINARARSDQQFAARIAALRGNTTPRG